MDESLGMDPTLTWPTWCGQACGFDSLPNGEGVELSLEFCGCGVRVRFWVTEKLNPRGHNSQSCGEAQTSQTLTGALMHIPQPPSEHIFATSRKQTVHLYNSLIVHYFHEPRDSWSHLITISSFLAAPWTQEVPMTEQLKFQSGAFSIPHPEKASKCGSCGDSCWLIYNYKFVYIYM